VSEKQGGLKAKLYEMCNEVASEFPNWDFSNGRFKNKSLQHTILTIEPGFSFSPNSTPLQPFVEINHKRSMTLFKKLNGYDLPTSVVKFQTVPHLLEHMPEDLRLLCSILADKDFQMKVAPPSEVAKRHMIDITESRPVLRAMMQDGIALIEKLYVLDSEETLLRNLPPKYTPRSDKSPYAEFERSKGVMVCIVRALSGDFDFAFRYRDDSYTTIFPKRYNEIDNLLKVVPEMKIQFAKTGKVTLPIGLRN
jgi:hypothetical protein